MTEQKTGWKKYIFYHAPWQIGMILIFISSSISSDRLPDIAFKISDKLIHFMVFGILAILMFRSFELVKIRTVRENAFTLSVIFAALYGALDEFHQYFVPGRFTSLYDWIADVLGVIILLYLYRKFLSSRISI